MVGFVVLAHKVYVRVVLPEPFRLSLMVGRLALDQEFGVRVPGPDFLRDVG